MAKNSKGLPRYSTTGSTSGSGPNKTSGSMGLGKDSNGKQVAGKGIAGARHSVTKPSMNAGSIIKTSKVKDQKHTTLGKSYIKTTPNK